MAKAVQLQTMQNSVRSLADQLDNDYVTQAELATYLNKELDYVYDLVIQSYEDQYLSSQSLTILAGTQNYALPTDFLKLKGVDIILSAGNPLAVLTLKPFDWNKRNLPIYIVNPTVYTMRYRVLGSNLTFVPSPSSAYTGTLWYYPCRADLSAPTDTFDGFNGWEELAVIRAAIRCREKSEEDVATLMEMSRRMEERLIAMSANRDADQPHHIQDTSRRYDATSGFYGGW